MATMTRVTLTPKDHGREIDPDVFEDADGKEGYTYEIIDGRIYVAPSADVPHNLVEDWLFMKLKDYSRTHCDVVNYISGRARIFVTGRPKATRPEPDIAAYHDFPLHLSRNEVRWQDVSPILVVEILSNVNPGKDLSRNVDLYRDVPSIKEYWIVNPLPNADRPSLLVYRRRGKVWQKPIEVPFGETYQSPRVLPGFNLVVDPDR